MLIFEGIKTTTSSVAVEYLYKFLFPLRYLNISNIFVLYAEIHCLTRLTEANNRQE